MKQFVLIIVLSILGLNRGEAQNEDTTCPCIDELDEVSVLVRQSKSYKDVVKGKRKDAFKRWLQQVKQEATDDKNIDAYCIGYLNKLLTFIPDAHNEVYKTKAQLKFTLPQFSGDVKTLEAELSNTVDPIEGIYFLGSSKVAVIHHEEEWLGVSLESQVEKWTPGSIVFKLKQKEDGYEMFEFTGNGQMLYRPKVTLQENRLFPSIWNKDKTYHFYNQPKVNFEFKAINDSIDYMMIYTLKRTSKLMKELATFYETHLPNVTKANLIIDLRNNSGGSVLQAKELVKFVKKNPQIHIYVLVNTFTGSAAELTTLKLNKFSHVTLAGEPTRGRLAYGYGNQAISLITSCGYKTLFTVEKSNTHTHHDYTGIIPDIRLMSTTDWVDQLVRIIKQ